MPATEAGSVTGLKLADIADTGNTLALVEVKEPFNWMDPMADVTLEEFIRGERIGGHHLNAIFFNGGITNLGTRSRIFFAVVFSFCVFYSSVAK